MRYELGTYLSLYLPSNLPFLRYVSDLHTHPRIVSIDTPAYAPLQAHTTRSKSYLSTHHITNS